MLRQVYIKLFCVNKHKTKLEIQKSPKLKSKIHGTFHIGITLNKVNKIGRV